ncbi:hypothetical protein GCM10023196_004650 [Actinoallomurus vinaceus]|uniref:Uncharacterized protein n=1 Tax=Actinoallomurus vinaceus TaxID=1080074 RepID=A0ABP8U233_9ACTN
MIPLGERRRKAREQAARFDAQLTVFGEMLAVHPFAVDRPGSTHEMAVEYARALDAYEAAKREAGRDVALARRELDAGMAALNRLNTHLVGTSLPQAGMAEPNVPTPKAKSRTPRANVTTSAGPVGPDVPRPTPTQTGAADGRSRPRLRDRYMPEQLALRAGLVALVVYTLAVIAVGTWIMALCSILFLNVGLGLAGGGGIFAWAVLNDIRGAVKGGLVEAEYRHTAKKAWRKVDEAPWEQHYVYVDSEGRELIYRRGVPSGSLKPLPTRRLWLIEGDRPELRAFWPPLLSPLSLIFTVPLFLAGAVVSLGAVPGVLIAALMGHSWG